MENMELFSADINSHEKQSEQSGVQHPGFTSTAKHLMENAIDLNRDLVVHPESTFYARVRGESMRDIGVGDGDILMVDKSIDWQSGDLAVCVYNGEFIVKLVEVRDNRLLLQSANDGCPPIEVSECDEFEIWGVVTYVIHKMRGRTKNV